MSFRCDICGEPQETGVQPSKVVMKTRRKEYAERWKQVPHGKPIKIDKGGQGREIVEEKMVCPSCLIIIVNS